MNKDLNIDLKGTVLVEYVWIGGLGSDIRSKTRTFKKNIECVLDVPKWNYDGSSTYQASTEISEIEIVPVCLFDDPFRGLPHKIVICETFHHNGKPTLSNFRFHAKKIFDEINVQIHEPWFGIEQEYYLLKYTGTQSWPHGWSTGYFPEPQGLYYCGNGAHLMKGREIAEAHLKLCLNAGVKIYGLNAEVFPSQWEFQVGTCLGIEVCDHLLMARFILIRVAESYDVSISFEPKYFKDWNGSGAHTNYSTNGTRNDTEMKEILKHMEILQQNHSLFLSMYGIGNENRLCGKYETGSYDKFDFGVMNRKSSVRIPQATKDSGNGYYEDRRPASNCDPYIIPSLIFSSTCLLSEGIDDIYNQYKLFKESID